MADYSHPSNRVVHTTITIAAPPEVIFKVITDFSALPEWSSFLKSVKPVTPDAPLAIGQKVNVSILPPGNASPMSFTASIVLLDPPHSFGWLGGYSYIYLGKHMFLLSPSTEEPGKTVLVHREEFSGALYVPIMDWMGAGEKTKKGFEKFNEEVKARAEKMAAGA
ncbi:hypothetical protein NCC49_003264 [Naganishia albida]|nr:hypothetical protein NCC49_003264 [Naganishia albida]